jgi:hypothetical protein
MGRLDDKRGVSDDDIGVCDWEVDGTSVDAEEVGGRMQLPSRSTPRGHVTVGEEEGDWDGEEEGDWDD